MIRRFFLSLLCLVSLMPGCASLPGGTAPAAAQSLTFTPVPTPAAPPRLVFTPLATSAQVAALTAQLAASQAQAKAAKAQLAALTPSVWGQPYANTTGRLTLAHYLVAERLGYDDSGNLVPGYVREMQETVSWGGDGWAIDYGSLDSDYLSEIDQIYQAAAVMNASIAAGTAVNPAGIKKFVIVQTPDMSGGIGEDPATITALATLFLRYANNPASLTWPDRVTGALRPVLSMYVGDGGGVPVVSAVYNPMLTQIRAGVGGYPGVNVFFVPDWSSTAELSAVGADGGWLFANTQTLSAYSNLPATEAFGAAVQATKTSAGAPLLFMEPVFPDGYHDILDRNGFYYNEYGGAKALAAQMMSAINVVKPPWVVVLTQNDTSESLISNLAVGSAWSGLTNYNLPDFWQRKDGIQRVLAYYIQWYKTGVQPVITQDTLCIFNHVHTAAAAAAPVTGNPIGPVTGIAGEPSGLQDRVDVTALLTKSGFVRVTCGSYSQTQFTPAGVSHLTFLGVPAGMPIAEFVVQGQVTKQVTGHPIAATAQQLNLNVSSRVSVPGVAFTMTVPLPSTFGLDSAAIVCRSANAANHTLGVKNLKATDLTPSTPVVFAKASLNDPAHIGQPLQSVSVAGDDPLVVYENAFSPNQCSLLADPLGAIQPPLAFGNASNVYQTYFIPSKPLPSTHIRLEGDVVCVSTDTMTDTESGIALVSSTAPSGHYFGVGVLFCIHEAGGAVTLEAGAYDSLLNGTNSQGAQSLGGLPLNTLAPGESYHLSVEIDLAAHTATVTGTPSNQQL